MATSQRPSPGPLAHRWAEAGCGAGARAAQCLQRCRPAAVPPGAAGQQGMDAAVQSSEPSAARVQHPPGGRAAQRSLPDRKLAGPCSHQPAARGADRRALVAPRPGQQPPGTSPGHAPAPAPPAPRSWPAGCARMNGRAGGRHAGWRRGAAGRAGRCSAVRLASTAVRGKQELMGAAARHPVPSATPPVHFCGEGAGAQVQHAQRAVAGAACGG